jgi:hypothetical protein
MAWNIATKSPNRTLPEVQQVITTHKIAMVIIT